MSSLPAPFPGLATCDPVALAAVDRSSWSVPDRLAELVAVRAHADQLCGVAAQLLAQVQEHSLGLVEQDDGHLVTVAAWLHQHERLHVTALAHQVRRAQRLAALPLVLAAVQHGSIRTEHAEVLQSLVGKVDPALLAAAEPVLVELAQAYEPGALKTRVRAWLAEHSLESFTAQENRAADAGWVQLDDQGDGRHKLHGYLPSGQAEGLLTALAALMGRREEDDRRNRRQRRADALIELGDRALAAGELPEHGGLPAQISLVIACDPVTGAPGAVASAPHSGPLAPYLSQMWTCEAELTPTYVKDGQVIALGRSTRNVNRAQRRALAARDGGCTAYGCIRPPGACDAHHLIHWTDGGKTDLDNLTLLCRWHHQQWHRGRLGLHQLKIPWHHTQRAVA